MEEFIALMGKFFPFPPTQGQADVLRVFATFMASPQPMSVMVLRGSAGTGKTTLTAAIVRMLTAYARKVVLLAPTGRAAKVLSVNADGAESFVVYGYMNRGSHEGQMGISVCQYDAGKNTVDEILYVPRNDIYEVIEKDVETLAYLNGDGRFFMYQGGRIYSIYYDTKEYRVVSSQVIAESCLFSAK